MQEVVLAVALLDPAKTLPGTDWHPWFYLREMVMLGLALASLTVVKISGNTIDVEGRITSPSGVVTLDASDATAPGTARG